jgi:hypothetical protein
MKLLAAVVLAAPGLAAAQAAPPSPPAAGEAAPQAPAPAAAAAPERAPERTAPSSTTSPAPIGSAPNTDATAPGVAVGLPVKDNTGVLIGLITDVKTDTDGKQVAVVRMGPDAFSVETDRLAVQNGAASINATQAQLKSMIRRR